MTCGGRETVRRPAVDFGVVISRAPPTVAAACSIVIVSWSRLMSRRRRPVSSPTRSPHQGPVPHRQGVGQGRHLGGGEQSVSPSARFGRWHPRGPQVTPL